MDTINIAATVKTPVVKFDSKTGKLEIKGKSIPEDTIGFYKPIIEVLKNYANGPVAHTQADIHLEYFNTASAKCLVDIFKCLFQVQQKGNKVIVNWYYESDDEDMESVGTDLQELTGLHFEMKMIDV